MAQYTQDQLTSVAAFAANVGRIASDAGTRPVVQEATIGADGPTLVIAYGDHHYARRAHHALIAHGYHSVRAVAPGDEYPYTTRVHG